MEATAAEVGAITVEAAIVRALRVEASMMTVFTTELEAGTDTCQTLTATTSWIPLAPTNLPTPTATTTRHIRP
jgi:hypothetical protein